MRKLRLLVPIAVIAALVLLLMAPAGALAAPSQHGGGHHGWHNDGNKGWDNDCSGGFNYRVRWGDTVGNIAWRFGVNSTYLARVNGLWNPNRIYAGQVLWIPSSCW